MSSGDSHYEWSSDSTTKLCPEQYVATADNNDIAKLFGSDSDTFTKGVVDGEKVLQAALFAKTSGDSVIKIHFLCSRNDGRTTVVSDMLWERFMEWARNTRAQSVQVTPATKGQAFFAQHGFTKNDGDDNNTWNLNLTDKTATTSNNSGDSKRGGSDGSDKKCLEHFRNCIDDTANKCDTNAIKLQCQDIHEQGIAQLEAHINGSNCKEHYKDNVSYISWNKLENKDGLSGEQFTSSNERTFYKATYNKNDILLKHSTNNAETVRELYFLNVTREFGCGVPKVYGWTVENDNVECTDPNKKIWLVLEFVDGKDLVDYEITEDNKFAIIDKLFSINKCLDNLGIIHNDISMENVMVDNRHNKIYFIDFGGSCPSHHCTMRHALGKEQYMPTSLQKFKEAIDKIIGDPANNLDERKSLINDIFTHKNNWALLITMLKVFTLNTHIITKNAIQDLISKYCDDPSKSVNVCEFMHEVILKEELLEELEEQSSDKQPDKKRTVSSNLGAILEDLGQDDANPPSNTATMRNTTNAQEDLDNLMSELGQNTAMRDTTAAQKDLDDFLDSIKEN